MKELEQRLAIATACGWKDIALRGRPQFQQEGYLEIRDLPPDYPNDLNAMHEAVKGLIFSKRQEYRRNLQLVMTTPSGEIVHMSECIDATAAQRAEAFLRTIGKWEGSA